MSATAKFAVQLDGVAFGARVRSFDSWRGDLSSYRCGFGYQGGRSNGGYIFARLHALDPRVFKI